MRWVTVFLAAIMPLLLALPAAAGEGAAGASAWAASEAGRVRLIAAGDSVGPGAAPARLALEFDLAPGWKIYWRTPGDAGYPPALDWAGSDNLAAAALRWPAPHRFVLGGLQNYGYQGRVALPLAVSPAAPGRGLALRARLSFLACATLCVPQQADLALDLPAGDGADSAYAAAVAAAEAAVPGDGAAVGLTLERVEARGTGAEARLRLIARAEPPFADPDLFVESAAIPAFGQPKLRLSSDRRRLEIEIAPAEPPAAPLAGTPVTVTLTDGGRALEAAVSVAAAPAGSDTALAAMLLVALLGGLVLNLMPCVLPVLSIKLLGILGHGGGERAAARRGFLASAAGIVASFLLLAGLAAGLRQAGLAVGWGIQFQQPVFLGVMIVLLLGFAANLWGLYQIALPRWLLDRLPAGPGPGGIGGNFLAGAFATLLATPCSAPFVGTAITFALGRGPVEIVAIFLALGLGMAAPFLLVAVWPDAVLRLPRPGRWMLRLRAALGVALAATALWLGLVLVEVLRAPDRAAAPAAGAVKWVAFDPAAIPALVAEGKVVLVDVTADWCITCKVNEAAVLEREPVAGRLAAPGVVAMRGDWTRPDPAITAYLGRFDRYAIPFNAVYGPGVPDGVALPELLTSGSVMAALERAARQ